MSLSNLLVLLSLISLAWSKLFGTPTTFVAKQQQFHPSLFLLEMRGGSDNNDEEEESLEEYTEEYVDDEEEPEIVLTDGPGVEEEDEEMEPGFITTDGEQNISTFVDVMEARIATTTDDENSSAFVDRMELADAYDEADTSVDQEVETTLAAVTAATVIGGASDEQSEEHSEDAEAEAEEISETAVAAITDEMKKILIKNLKYKVGEVKALRPDIAASLIEKNLRRPSEGLPQNWFIEGAAISPAGLRERTAKVGMALVVLGGVSVLGLKGGMNIGASIGAIPAAMKSILPAKSTKSADITSTTAIVPVKELPTENVEDMEEEEDHPQSVKPYSTEAPHFEDDLDKSWLDKIITRVENAFKAFLRIKI
jgi:hypothetical protein